MTTTLLKPKPNHTIDDKVLNSYDLYIRQIITGKRPIIYKHVLDSADAIKFTEEMGILDMTKTKKYERRNLTYKPQLHWGQLKLFLGEVEFLTRVLKQAPKDADIWFVYAGAAPGQHINYLHSLFPSVNFELYDPNDFIVKDSDKLKTHVQFFTDEDARYWAEQAKSKYVVFCSDIRSEPATQENVARNMEIQLEWWKIMKPELSMFKFRLPWTIGQTLYLAGDICIQAYPGPTSTETRLICKKDACLISYDNITYEEACYYHNVVQRQKNYITHLGLCTLQRDGLDTCYDCARFIQIMSNYLELLGRPLSELRDIINTVQNEISSGRFSVLSHTKKYINQSLNDFVRNCYYPCGKNTCHVCPSGIIVKDPISRGLSRATAKNDTTLIQDIA